MSALARAALSALHLSYDTDEEKMPPHVLLAHQKYACTPPDADDPTSVLTPPSSGKNILLHSCCAPCSGAMIHEMSRLNLNVTVIFYNPNIHPYAEYLIRKEENLKFCLKLKINFIDLDTDKDYGQKLWFKLAKGMESDAERGNRCTMCFDMRMMRTAEYAKVRKLRGRRTRRGWQCVHSVHYEAE